RTELDRSAARNSVATTKASILAGEAIVRANQQVGPTELERLNAYEEGLRNQGRLEETGVELAPIGGSILLNFLVLGIFALFFYFFRPEIYSNFRWMLLITLLVGAYFGAAGILANNNYPAELLPIAFVSLAVAVLWDSRAALVLAIILAVLTGAQPPFGNYPIVVTTLIGGAAAALSVRAVRRRAQTWVFIAIIAASYAGVILALGLIFRTEPANILLAIGWAGVNATGSAILAMGFLPVFEWFTRITTDQTLLEWADPNRPLLKRLSLEAPGTYAHTINVANLSEAAANAVGANGLLCRVGVYYHDVGKMLKPQYFIENQPGSRNPHDKLKPEHSAMIVREHVTEGIKLGKEAKLPEALACFIPEHHGTQKISFFYEKALEEGAEGLTFEDFCYPGPKPQSKETAIVMLADSVESATRSLQDPTRERLEELIESIVDTKIRDGQMDDAPLTLRDLKVIKEQFRKVLGGMYHHRIDYPATKHLTDAPSADGKPKGAEGAVRPTKALEAAA
ncbi:MAG: HDIG domain-containing metalloprotein, partial [Phycisphaeraceae bacterium]